MVIQFEAFISSDEYIYDPKSVDMPLVDSSHYSKYVNNILKLVTDALTIFIFLKLVHLYYGCVMFKFNDTSLYTINDSERKQAVGLYYPSIFSLFHVFFLILLLKLLLLLYY